MRRCMQYSSIKRTLRQCEDMRKPGDDWLQSKLRYTSNEIQRAAHAKFSIQQTKETDDVVLLFFLGVFGLCFFFVKTAWFFCFKLLFLFRSRLLCGPS